MGPLFRRQVVQVGPSDEEAGLTQTKAWARVLQDEGGEVMIAVQEERGGPSVQGVPAVRAEVLWPFRHQVDRMDDPSDEANG